MTKEMIYLPTINGVRSDETAPRQGWEATTEPDQATGKVRIFVQHPDYLASRLVVAEKIDPDSDRGPYFKSTAALFEPDVAQLIVSRIDQLIETLWRTHDPATLIMKTLGLILDEGI